MQPLLSDEFNNEITKPVSGTAKIISLDILNDYYDPALEDYRLSEIEKINDGRFTFVKGNLADKELITSLFSTYLFNVVFNLADQTGVRYSIDHPDVHIETNIKGFYNILDACRYSYDGVKKRWV